MAWRLCKRMGALFALVGSLAGAIAQPALEIRWMLGGAWREVSDIAFSPTDDIVAVSSYNKISLHDFSTRGVIREIASPPNQFYRAIAYSSDGQWLAAALESSVALYDARRGVQVWTRSLGSDSPTAIAVSPNGEYLAVGARGLNRVYLLRRSDGSIVRQWSHHTREVSSVHFTPDSEHVVSAAPDGEVCIWNVNGVSLVRRYSFGAIPDCQSALSPDGQLLALVGFTDNTVRLISLSTGAPIASLQTPARALRAAFTPDGQHLAVGVSLPQPGVHVWRLSDLTRLYPPYPDTDTPDASVTVVAFSPDGQYWIEASENSLLPIRRLDTGARVDNLLRMRDELPVLQLSHDLRTVYAGSPSTGRLYQWDCFTGAPVAPEFQERSGVASLAIDPTGQWIAIALRDTNAVAVRERATYAPWLEIPVGNSSLRTGSALGFSPDGSRLYAAPWARGGVAVWRLLSDGVLFERAIGAGGRQAAYAPNGRYIAALTTDQFAIWDAETGARLAVLGSPSFPWGVLSLNFSPDGRALAIVGFNNRLYVWRWQENVLHEITVNGSPRGAAFTADGRALAVSSSNRSLRFWRTDTWQSWVEFGGLMTDAHTLLFSSDGKHLVLGRADGAVAVARNPFYPDLNGDGVVDDADLLIVLLNFGNSGTNLLGDVNYDGTVDDADLLAVLLVFGQ